MGSRSVDVLILGAGPAGLSAAAGIARQLHTAIVFNSSIYRNACTNHMHNLPGFDHSSPSDFWGKSRSEVEGRYAAQVQFKDTEIRRVSKTDDGKFMAVDATGHEYVGKKIILATGVRDIMPDIPGFAGLWGTAIFHCVSCHAYEARGHPSSAIVATGQLANPASALAVCRMVARFADTVTIYTNNNPSFGAALGPLLKSTRFRFEDRKIASFAKDASIEGDAGVLVALEDGTVNTEGFVVHTPDLEQASTIAAQLGLDINPQGYVNVTAPFNAANVAGVFAAGDCATVFKSVPNAVTMGAMAAVGVGYIIQAEEDIE